LSKGILIVEDEGLVSLEIEENIERMGHNVLGIVDTGEEAIAAARDLQPDLILMDIRLKGDMDGVEAASAIRKDADIPVIFLTAYSGDEILRRASVTEPYGYLLKPIQEQQLESALRMTWYRHGQDIIRDRNIERFAAILKGLPHGVVLVDPERRVRYLNNRAKHMIGLTRFESWGRPLEEIVLLDSPDTRNGLLAMVDAVIAGGDGGGIGESTLKSHLEGGEPVLVEVAPFRNRLGEELGALVILSGAGTAETAGPDAGSGDALVDRVIAPPQDDSRYYPPATEMGQIRSFLELEIIRQTLDAPSDDPYNQGYRDGRVELNKSLLELFFGDDALREIESIITPQT
jgi:two-component system, cell cycle sensor histidine kinase and response regulator CckA